MAIACSTCGSSQVPMSNLGNGWWECRKCWTIWQLVGWNGEPPEIEPHKGWDAYSNLAQFPRPITPKQVWKEPRGWEVRVMGVVEKHVAYRRKGGAPSICHINQFRKEFTFVRAK